MRMQTYRSLSLWLDSVPGPLAPGDAAARRPRRRRGHRRRRVHRAVDRLLPGQRAARACGSRSARRRSPGSARPGATAAGAPRCSRRRWPSWTGWRAGTRRSRCTGPCRTRWTRSAGSPRPRASTATGPRAARCSWPARAAQLERARAEVAEARSYGFGEDDLRLLTAAEAREHGERDRRARRHVHPALRGDPPGAAGPGPGRGGAAARGQRVRATPRSPRSRRAGCAPRRGTVRARVRDPGHRGLHAAACPACTGRSRRCTR